MRSRESYGKRISDTAVAIRLCAGVSQFQPFSPRTVRASGASGDAAIALNKGEVYGYIRSGARRMAR
jgi:hypothetical protein